MRRSQRARCSGGGAGGRPGSLLRRVLATAPPYRAARLLLSRPTRRLGVAAPFVPSSRRLQRAHRQGGGAGSGPSCCRAQASPPRWPYRRRTRRPVAVAPAPRPHARSRRARHRRVGSASPRPSYRRRAGGNGHITARVARGGSRSGGRAAGHGYRRAAGEVARDRPEPPSRPVLAVAAGAGAAVLASRSPSRLLPVLALISVAPSSPLWRRVGAAAPSVPAPRWPQRARRRGTGARTPQQPPFSCGRFVDVD